MLYLPRFIPFTLATLLLFIGIGLVGYELYPPEGAPVAQVTVSSGSVSLAFTPATAPLTPNSEATIPLTFNSGVEHLSGIQVELTYDSSFVTPLSFTPSSTFPTTLQAVQIGNGKITFAYGVGASSGGTVGSGNVGSLKLKALKAGTTTLTFTQNTLATTTERTTNAIKNATDLPLTITVSPFPGDLNSDNTVNLLDFNLLISKFGNPYTLLDFNLIIANFGNTR